MSDSTKDLIDEITSLSGDVQKNVRRMFELCQMLQTVVRREWGGRQRAAETPEALELVNLDVRRQMVFAQTWLRFAGSTDAGFQRALPTRKLIEATAQDAEEMEELKARQAAVQARRERRQAQRTQRLWPSPEDIESLYREDLVDDGR
ncbi:MAG: hypothetical protein WC565_09300 [Parcubacteria group bacterium]|jgi:hypothetical protein